jgi:hypothetical protein
MSIIIKDKASLLAAQQQLRQRVDVLEDELEDRFNEIRDHLPSMLFKNIFKFKGQSAVATGNGLLNNVLNTAMGFLDSNTAKTIAVRSVSGLLKWEGIKLGVNLVRKIIGNRKGKEKKSELMQELEELRNRNAPH